MLDSKQLVHWPQDRQRRRRAERSDQRYVPVLALQLLLLGQTEPMPAYSGANAGWPSPQYLPNRSSSRASRMAPGRSGWHGIRVILHTASNTCRMERSMLPSPTTRRRSRLPSARIATSPSYYAFRDHFLLVGPPSNPANLGNSSDVLTMFSDLMQPPRRGRLPRRCDSRVDTINLRPISRTPLLWVSIGQVRDLRNTQVIDTV